MKKRFLLLVCAVVFLITASVLFFSGCNFGDDGNDGTQEDPTPKEYTIQYTDDAGVHSLTVTDGMPYSLDTIPEKTGYDFNGLYDAQVGGTQYIAANGSSLSPFTDKKNMVLFPQFTAKDYTVILDFGGATATGSRQHTVTYGANLPELPKTLTLEHKTFKGWYTQPDRGGVQVADEQGLIPLVSVLNETNFDLKKSSFTLYAGFETEKHKVTFCFEEGMDTEEMQVEYDTPINKVVPTTRVEGNAVLTWSKTEGGEVFTGNIKEDTVLYAVEYAPVIEFNTDGGNSVTPVVARPGSTVALPAPTKDLANFVKWEDARGNTYTSTTMPSKSITLKAIWQAKIAFDENGGTNVDDIAVAAGNSVRLPTPTREGYIFAGWYTADKERYTSTTMPVTGVGLKAGWYKEKSTSITLVENDTDKKLNVNSNSFSARYRIKVDLSDYIPTIPEHGVGISYKINFKWGHIYKYKSATGQIALYEGDELNSSYQLAYKSLSHGDDRDKYGRESLSGNSTINNKILYLYYSGQGSGSWGSTEDVAFLDIYIELNYPILSNLYL